MIRKLLHPQICNGGVMFVPYRLTGDKFECHMSINYLSHCLLILKLLPLLAARPSLQPSSSSTANTPKSRVVIVSSGAHHASLGLRLHDLHSTSLYSVYHGYAQSKLSLVMFTYALDQWLTTQRPADLRPFVSVNCLHPGVCRTGLMERFNFFKLKFIQETPLFRVCSRRLLLQLAIFINYLPFLLPLVCKRRCRDDSLRYAV